MKDLKHFLENDEEILKRRKERFVDNNDQDAATRNDWMGSGQPKKVSPKPKRNILSRLLNK